MTAETDVEEGWREISWADCPCSCGGTILAQTDATNEHVYDGDDAKCTTCDWEGCFAVEEADEDGVHQAHLQDGNISEICWEHNKLNCTDLKCAEE